MTFVSFFLILYVFPILRFFQLARERRSKNGVIAYTLNVVLFTLIYLFSMLMDGGGSFTAGYIVILFLPIQLILIVLGEIFVFQSKRHEKDNHSEKADL